MTPSMLRAKARPDDAEELTRKALLNMARHWDKGVERLNEELLITALVSMQQRWQDDVETIQESWQETRAALDEELDSVYANLQDAEDEVQRLDDVVGQLEDKLTQKDMQIAELEDELEEVRIATNRKERE